MTISTTRAQRRELERKNARLPAYLELVPRHEWPIQLQSSNVLRVWRSRDFLVQEYTETGPLAAEGSRSNDGLGAERPGKETT